MQAIDLRATASLLDHAAHVHLRDAAPGTMQVEFGTGTVDLAWLLGALREREYRGHISLGYLRTPGFDVRASARRLLEAVAKGLA